MTKMLTQERLKELLSYDPETGVFVWKVDRSRTAKAGQRAGCVTNGYTQIAIEGKQYLAHRIAWLYVYNYWPTNQIDHINRVRDDNRLDNLREATRQQNAFNTKARGYHWNKSKKKWRADIMLNGKHKHLGYYDTEEEARAAYLNAKAEHHKIGEHYGYEKLPLSLLR